MKKIQNESTSVLSEGTSGRTVKKLKITEQDEFGPAAALLAELHEARVALYEAGLKREADRQKHAVEIETASLEREKLEKQVRFLSTEEDKLRTELNAVKLKSQQECGKLEAQLTLEKTRVESLHSQSLNLREKLKSSNLGLEGDSRSSQEFFELNSQLETKSREVAQLRKREAHLEKELTKLQSDLEEERRNIRSHAIGLAGDQAELAEMSVLRKKNAELERQVSALESKTHTLLIQHQNTALLEEQRASLSSKLQRAEALLAEGASLQAEYEATHRERLDWARLFTPLVRSEDQGVTAEDEESELVFPTPHAALDLLHHYRAEKEASEKKTGIAEAQMVKLTADFEEIRKERLILSGLIAKEQEKVLSLEETVKALDITNRRLVREVGHLQDQLKILEDCPLSGSANQEDSSENSKRKDEKIRSLEEALKHAQNEVAELQNRNKLMTPSSVLSKSRDRVSSLEAKLEETEKTNTQLLRHLEKVERDLAKYEHDAAKGDYNRATTKVVHFSQNPTARAAAKRSENKMIQELAILREENEQLKTELKNSKGEGAAYMSGTDSDLNSSRIDGLDSNKLNQRLKEMFKERIKTFREAVYQLFGFKVDMATDREKPKLRLRSMFAELESDDLLFQWGDNGLELVETDFAKRMENKIFVYLHKCNSVPAFLSNVTLHLFEQQTFQG